jgi:methionine synthase II (cobalamin-independent)
MRKDLSKACVIFTSNKKDKGIWSVPYNKLWANPEYIFTTRGRDETEKFLKKLVTASNILRKEYKQVK